MQIRQQVHKGERTMRNVPPHFGRIVSLCLFAVCLAALFSPAYAKTPEGKDLLQFTSGGHVVGFRSGSMYVASPTHMLKVDFLGSKAVAPVSKKGPATVTYPRVWDGVDIVFETTRDSIIKSTYTISPGKEPASIRLRYNRPLTIDAQGNLIIAYNTGAMTESKPIAWQIVEGRKKPVMVAYNLQSEKELGFRVGDYDRKLPLVIDPSLTWNTFLGGSGYDMGWAMAVDTNGNVYMTGYSNAGWGSPVRAFTGGWDCFVAKLAADGTLLWNTFLGGNGDYDYGQAIALDSSGNVYVTGGTNGTWGSPVRAYGGGWDCFVAKLATNGTLLWNTFLGDSADEGGRGMTADSTGNVYVTGYGEASWGSPVRAFTGGDDAFVAKLAADGTLLWNTFLGGNGNDSGWAMTADSTGNVYVGGESGETWGSPVREYTAGDDAFVAKLAADGTLLWNTFLGGNGNDYLFGMAGDSNGYLYVAGQSYASWGSPVRAYEELDDAFVAKLTTDGGFVWNTFLGGSGSDRGYAVTVDPMEGVYVAGGSDATWGSPFRPYTENDDAFVAKLAFDGTLTWNAFLGGSSSDTGYAVVADLSGGIYVAGTNWDTWGSPIRAYTTGADAFIAKIIDTNPCRYTLKPTSKSFAYAKMTTTVTIEATGAANCPKPVLTPSDTWIIPSLVSFKGNKGRLKITVSKNGSVAEREGTFAIEGSAFTVTQGGAPCVLTISPGRAGFNAAGGSGVLSVTATDGCAWTAEVESKAASWLGATPTAGAGSGTITYTASVNNTQKSRTGRVTVYQTQAPTKRKVLTVAQKK
jgi:uncharacterized delta-60 repeat protein